MRNYVRGFAGITGLMFILMMSLVSVCSADIIATNGKYYVYEYDSGDRAVFYQSGSEQDPSTDEVLHNKNSYGMLKDKEGKVLIFEVEITYGGSTYKMPSPVYESGKFANQKTDGEGYWLDQISNFVMDASTNQRLTDPNDPLVFYYCNEQPSSQLDANGDRIMYDYQGNEVARIPASDIQPYVPTDPTDLHFHDAYMKPVWNDPIDPTADGQHKSGVIKLNGGTDTAGWNGSSLHYYFVDTSEQSAFTKNHLIAASTIASTQAAATIAAQALNIPFPNGTAAAVAAALAVGSTANALNLITQAAGVDTYTAHYVGAISYNGDFIVTGGGTLAGTYQNLNTMSLDANDYTISKQVFTTDLLEAQGNLTVTENGNIFAVNNISVSQNLTNAGKIEGVDSFSVTGDLTNTGTIANVNHLTAASVTNSNFLTVNQMNLTGALTNSGNTKVYGSMTSASVQNTGSFITTGSVETGEFTSNGSGDSCVVFIGGNLIAGGVENTSGMTVYGRMTASNLSNTGTMNLSDVILTNNLLNSGVIYSSGYFQSSEGTISNAGSLITIKGIEAAGDLTSTGAGESTLIYTQGRVKAANITISEGAFYAVTGVETGNLVIDGTDVIFNVDSIVKATDISNAGTASIAGAIQAQSLTNSGTFQTLSNVQLTSDLENTGTFTTLGNVTARNVAVTGSNAQFTAQGNVVLTYNLMNEGTTTIQNNLSAVKVTNKKNATLVVGGNTTLTGELEANGETTVAGNVKANSAKVGETGKLAVGGDAELTGDLEANGETGIVGNLKANGAKVGETGKLAVGGNAELSGDLEADGETAIAGNVKANAAKVAETGSLAVGGNAELSGDLEADGETAIVGNVKAKDAKISETGTLAVGGNADLSGNLEADGETAIVGNVKANAAKVAETGSLAVGGNAELAGDLEADGETTVAGNVKANAAKVGESGSLAVGGNAELSGTLETDAETIIAGNVKSGRTTISANGALTVGGNSEMNGLENAGAATLVGSANILADLQNTGTLNFGNQITVTDDLTNSGTMEALTVSAGIKAKSSLANSGSILNARFIEVDQDVTNAQGALIYGKGFASTFIAFGAVENQGDIKNFESVSVGSLTNSGQLETTTFLSEGPVTNSGTMLGTGEGSLFKFLDDLENAGTMGGVEKLVAKENVTNSWTLASTGKDSKLSIGGNLTNEADVSNFESADVAGKVTNSADGTITASGAGSNYTFGELENAGTVGGVEKLAVDENLTNSGILASTGKNSSLLVRNELRNEGNGEISNFESADVTGKVTNEADATITASGAGSNYMFGEFENAGTIQNLDALEVTGTANVSGSILGIGTSTASLKTGELTGEGGAFSGTVAGFGTVTNDSDLTNAGLIQGTGANSVLNQNGKLTNQSELSNFQTVNVAGELQNENLISGTGTNSTLTANGIQNSADGTIQAFDSITSNGDVQNEGQILGNPAGTNFQVTGNVTNAENGLIADTTHTTISGNFTNAGTLTGFKDIIVDQDFTNESTGTINVQVYDGKTSKISVNGAATLNGGTINFYGERLEVGKDYAFLLVEGSEAGALNHDPTWSEDQEQTHGLTVNSPLTITATNSAYGENSSITPSSDISSAIPKLFHAEGFYNQNEYWVSLRRDYTYGDLEGASEDQQAVGKYVDRIAYSINTTNDSYDEGDLFKVLEALDDSRESGGDSLGNLDQLSGAIYSNQGLLGMQNTWFAHQNLANFIRPIDCVYDEPELNGHNLWGGFVGNSGNFKSDGNGQGSTYDSAGVIVGCDFIRSFNFRGGTYFQYQNVRASEREVASGSKTDYYDLGLYGLYLNEYGYIMASGNLSYGSFQSSRYVAFGGEHAQIARQHEGERGGLQESIRFETALTLSFAEDRLLLHPFVGLTFIHMSMGDMIESGGDEYVTALRSSGYDLNSLRPELGARLSCCHRRENVVFGLNLRGSWVHEFCDTQTTIENRFSNPNYAASALPGQSAYNNPSDNAFNDESATFFVTSSNLGRDYAWLGFGLTADTSSRWTFFGGYDVLTNSRATIHTGNLGLSYSW